MQSANQLFILLLYCSIYFCNSCLFVYQNQFHCMWNAQWIKTWILILSHTFRPLSFMWHKKDAELPPLVRPDGAYLRFEALNKSDNGVYLCQADNGIGWNEGSYTLLVQGNKQIWQKGTNNKTLFSFCFQLLLSSFVWIYVPFSFLFSLFAWPLLIMISFFPFFLTIFFLYHSTYQSILYSIPLSVLLLRPGGFQPFVPHFLYCYLTL